MQNKITHFIGSIQDGGAETLVKEYSLLIDQSRFDTSIIIIRKNCNTANDRILSESGIKIIPIFKSNYLPIKIIQKLNYWWYIPYRLNKIIRSQNTDILHIHLTLLHYVDKVSKKLKNTKLFYTCHSEPKVLLSGARMYEYKAAKHLITENELRMIALHDDMRQEINEMFGINNTVVIRNGIDFDRFRNISETRDQVRNNLSIPQEAFVIGHVGRFHEVKNHAFLIDVFSEICRQRDDAFLLLVGDGPLRTSVENKLNSIGLQGKYLILSHRSDIPELMRAMDVFVFPSLYEGLGIALIEAQVSGLRCIASDTIPEEAFKTESAVPMSLDSPASEWCRVILDDSIKGVAHGNIEDYDMNKEIKRLEKLYLGELDG